MGWTGDPVWLAEVLRAEDLTVLEHEGWRDRGHGDFADLRGVLCHHTGGGGPEDWKTVQFGRPDLPGPLAQLVLEKNGLYRVIAAGVCWHAGRGRWPGWPTDNANYHVIGIEAVSRGDGSDWTPVQLDAYRRGCAAILRRIGRNADDCVAHREYSTEGKIDPAGIDMVAFRADVQRIIERKDTPMSSAEVKQIQDFVAGFCGPIGSDVKDIREQLCGLRGRDAGEYPGWPQLGGRTVVDALSEVLARLTELESKRDNA